MQSYIDRKREKRKRHNANKKLRKQREAEQREAEQRERNAQNSREYMFYCGCTFNARKRRKKPTVFAV